jgi:hypothetical protein
VRPLRKRFLSGAMFSAVLAVPLVALGVPATAATSAVPSDDTVRVMGGYFQTTAAVNIRNCAFPADRQCHVIETVPQGATVWVECWVRAASVNGDNVWYHVFRNGKDGMMAGYYLNTGRDPNPSIRVCPGP